MSFEKENPNQATLNGLEEFKKQRVALTIDEVKKMRDKAQEDIKKILTDLIEDTGVIPDLKTDIKTMKSVDGKDCFSGLCFEIEIKI